MFPKAYIHRDEPLLRGCATSHCRRAKAWGGEGFPQGCPHLHLFFPLPLWLQLSGPENPQGTVGKYTNKNASSTLPTMLNLGATGRLLPSSIPPLGISQPLSPHRNPFRRGGGGRAPRGVPASGCAQPCASRTFPKRRPNFMISNGNYKNNRYYIHNYTREGKEDARSPDSLPLPSNAAQVFGGQGEGSSPAPLAPPSRAGQHPSSTPGLHDPSRQQATISPRSQPQEVGSPPLSLPSSPLQPQPRGFTWPPDLHGGPPRAALRGTLAPASVAAAVPRVARVSDAF